MKANAAQEPGSARSRGTPLSRFTTPARRYRIVCGKCVHYAYKMRPNCKTQILIRDVPSTYKSDLQKCTHFPVYPARNHNPTPNPAFRGANSVEPLTASASPRLRISQSPLCASASLRLCVESPVVTRPWILDKIRLLRLRLGTNTPVFLMDPKTFLRPVSFCPVLRSAFTSPHFVSIRVNSWLIQN
jgi:hypothetical protein